MPKTKKERKKDINAKKNSKFQISKGARKKRKNKKKTENDKNTENAKKRKYPKMTKKS